MNTDICQKCYRPYNDDCVIMYSDETKFERIYIHAACREDILKERREAIARAKEAEMRELVYLEDHQGYSTSAIAFRTNCPLNVDALRKISFERPGAGRFSTSFEEFAERVRARGYICTSIKDFGTIRDQTGGADTSKLTKEGVWNDYVIVKGAEGNY